MSERAVHELLTALVEGDLDVAARALDASAVLVQGDGVVIEGRDAVLARFAASDDGTSHAVVARTDDTVTVRMTVAGVPGAWRFVLHGEGDGVALRRVTVRLGG